MEGCTTHPAAVFSFERSGCSTHAVKVFNLMRHMQFLLNADVSFIQLLLHPCWWESETDKRVIYKAISKRKQNDLDEYLLSNFSKVFGNVIKRGD